jgi:flagellar biosynthesis component FlhA
MLGLVKLKWTDHVDLFGFTSFVMLLMIIFAPIASYLLFIFLNIHMLASAVIILILWACWTYAYLEKHTKTCTT